jgi:hypothetical protein
LHLREYKKNETNQQALPKAVLGIIRIDAPNGYPKAEEGCKCLRITGVR